VLVVMIVGVLVVVVTVERYRLRPAQPPSEMAMGAAMPMAVYAIAMTVLKGGAH
jgi:hypothetical protein